MQKSNSAEAQKGFKDWRIQGFECNAPDTEDSAEAGGEDSRGRGHERDDYKLLINSSTLILACLKM